MAKVRVYRTYRFIDKDPIIDKVRTALQDEKLYARLDAVADVSGVTVGTLHNWFDGPTRRPQHATLAAVVTAVGYEMTLRRVRKINVEEEQAKAAAWRKRQKE